MKMLCTGRLSVMFSLLLLAFAGNGAPVMRSGAPALKFYVSPAGRDSWSGRLRHANKDSTDGPLATLEAARNAIRFLSSEDITRRNVVVEVLEGRYEMHESLVLDRPDSGKDSPARIIYQGEKGKEVRLSGGRVLGRWEQVTDSNVLERLDPGARDKIYKINLSAEGITNFGSPEGGAPELFFNDIPMQISRYPNKGFVEITGLLNEDPVDVRGTKGDRTGKFFYGDNRISAWKDEKDPWLYGYWFWDWSAQRQKIEDIDTVRKKIGLVPPYHTYGYRKGQWFYGFNLLCEIDEPGEYYIDRSEGILYFYPPSDINAGIALISLNDNIFKIKNVTNVTIRGMILEGCRETAVKIDSATHVAIENCVIRNSGDWAVVINDGAYNGVSGCEIHDAGGGGISISAGDRKSLSRGSCFAENNYIHHIARLKRVYNPGISISGVGNNIRHNVICHIPHMAVEFLGNDNIIEYNEIFDACYESNDAGAVYTGRDWTMRGNIIRYNYLHDISGFEGKGCVGIYLDDAFSSAEVRGNIFRNVTRAMMIGGGRDNTVVNNIFIDCNPSVHVDARGLGWMKSGIDEWLAELRDKGTVLGTSFDKPPYSTRYPGLVNIANDEPGAPKGNIISNNICFGGNWDKASGFWNVAIEDKARPYIKMENNVVSPQSELADSHYNGIIVADPLFVDSEDPEKSGYRLDRSSPALRFGFEQIPFQKIGLTGRKKKH